jgi:hypothetical protein
LRFFAKAVTGEAMRHQSFGAARANFHNQMIVEHLPGGERQ